MRVVHLRGHISVPGQGKAQPDLALVWGLELQTSTDAFLMRPPDNSALQWEGIWNMDAFLWGFQLPLL